MFLLDGPVRDVHVLHCGVVVLMSVGGEQVRPVLPLMKVPRPASMRSLGFRRV
jgi:hypothetical protein